MVQSRADGMSETQLKARLEEKLKALEDRLCTACRRAGRARKDVTLVAVTKTVSPGIAALLPELGILDLGESRPQELWRKADALPKTIRWHLIGHLQRNKVDRTLALVHLIHSVDSLRLLESLEQEAGKHKRTLSVLLEVNASREPAKHGLAPEELPGLVPRIKALRQVQVQGLMTMAALDAEPEHCRPTFAALRQLRDRLHQELGPPHDLRQLSMGMTNDFEVAIEEGATFVRVGSALFEGLAVSIA
jgi:pyridoxal phosphate enzyme (YggS family)